jgi:HAD superfamily 5'-nucleotidase-like hydrolase
MQPIQKVYTTRSLNMRKIKAIGYDMDHTLAVYHKNAFEDLAFRKTIEKFIAAGYPQELADFAFDPDFAQRGLLVDKANGNILKVDAHKYVKVAFHGHRELSKEERRQTYNNESYKAQNFVSVDTFFALSEVQIFVEIVDFMAKNPGRIDKSYAEIYDDLRLYIDTAHRDGSIKEVVLSNLKDYIYKDPHLSETLVKQLDAGKKIFLLTNSAWDYTNQIMTYLLEGINDYYEKWQDYFEIIIVSGRKPLFFAGQQPFFRIHTQKENLLSPLVGEFQKGHIYSGGNAASLQEQTGWRGDEILYVGDHIYGDIMTSKDLFNWRTALIVDELEEEMERVESQDHLKVKIQSAISEKEELEDASQSKKSELALKQRKAKKAAKDRKTEAVKELQGAIEVLSSEQDAITQRLRKLGKDIKSLVDQREQAIHPSWGELMRAGLERSRFADQVRDYACIYMARASNLRHYSQNKLFMTAGDTLPHER